MAGAPQTPPVIRLRENPSSTAALTWRLTAWVAAVFSALVGFALLLVNLRTGSRAPLESPQLSQLKDELRRSPGDEEKKRDIRELDLRLRQQHFRHLARDRSGRWLLAGGSLVFLLSMYQVARLEKQRPRPKPRSGTPQERAARTVATARWSVAASGGAIGAFLFILSFFTTAPLPPQSLDLRRQDTAGQSAAATSDAAPFAELEKNWPCFRGADANGASSFTNMPLKWDPNTGSGIGWKVAVPAGGFSSPIAWNGRVFLSGGDAARHEVLCFSGQTGQILWRQAVTDVPGSPAKPVEVPESSGVAAATMATDGRRVYAVFANGDLAAYSLEGKLAWSKGFGALKNPYGHASSLVTWEGRLIVQLDQGESEEGKSRLYALDGRTGQVLWQQPRKVPSSWASPIVFEAAGKTQVVALALPWAISYSATDGTELWRVECLSGEVLPSPTLADGRLFVASPSEKLLAIRPDGQGDVTKTHVVWTTEANIPDIASPVSNGELVFTLSGAGVLTAFDAKDGKKQWEHDFDMDFHASPGLAASRLYLFSQKGTALVVEAARQFRELFRTEMGDSFHASPAFVSDGIVLRGATNLWKLQPPNQR
ncbi:Pyrrolo-quinoline quinone (modular protein) [Verrucomicrobia bacterium]|nr:Pyrrolo-quinoline quinone (modular protein) [Verrucomicrobiota bacterium]